MTDDTEALIAMAQTLQDNGYLVFKVPPCNRNGHGHGRHVLLTRSAVCEGKEPVPHGFHSSHLGTFGFWNHCQCGRDFNDYSRGDDGQTPWERHVVEVAHIGSPETP